MNIHEFQNTKIPIVEIFSSISGEGISQGEVVSFVRVAGCNLRCNYCDTTYSYDEYSKNNYCMTPDEIVIKLQSLGCKDVICTGGEPLETSSIKRYLPLYLSTKGFDVRIETNGSCSVYTLEEISMFPTKDNLQMYYTLDVKCPGSGMCHCNIFEENFNKLHQGDELKFVVSDKNDINYALDVIDKYKDVLSQANVVLNFSPVFRRIEPKEIAEMLVNKHTYFSKNNLKTRLSLQIHKFIWDADAKGV